MSIDLFGPTVGAAGVTTRPTETRSFGAADTFFNDCSSQTADDGTEYQAAFFNAVLANWRSLGRGNGQTAGAVDVVTQDNSDDSLILKAVQYLIQRGVPNAAVDTGTSGHVVAAFSPAVVEHKFGTRLSVKILNTNPGDTDFAPNTLSALPIKRIGGVSLQPADLQSGGIAELFCMGPGTHYEIVSFIPPGSGGSTTKAPKLIGILASGSGGSVPNPGNSTVNFPNVTKNNLWGTSTFTSNTTLTVGAGEAGIWHIDATVGLATAAADTYASLAVYVNGSAAAIGTTTTAPTGDTADIQASASIALNVGDTVTIVVFVQSGSAVVSNGSTLSALLISAY